MIHTICVDDSTEIKALKKEFRKCLMTGGAVVRLKNDLSTEQIAKMIEVFSPGAEPHSLQCMVLEEIARAPQTSPVQLSQLESLALPQILSAIDSRQ